MSWINYALSIANPCVSAGAREKRARVYRLKRAIAMFYLKRGEPLLYDQKTDVET